MKWCAHALDLSTSFCSCAITASAQHEAMIFFENALPSQANSSAHSEQNTTGQLHRTILMNDVTEPKLTA